MTHSISCTYIGHATTLIKFGDIAFLTDPHLSSRVATQKRLNPLPLCPADLPKLEAVIVSHTHIDHLDISSFKFIECGTPVILPEGRSRSISRYLPNPVIELSHFASYTLPSGIVVTAAPAKHHMCKMLPCIPSKTNSYILRRPSDNASVYFCGDSAYGSHFSEIASMGPVDVALLPIGSYNPKYWMKTWHMDPKEALAAFADLKAAHMIPIHHGTFRLSLERPEEPARLLSEEVARDASLVGRIHILKAGEKFDIDKTA